MQSLLPFIHSEELLANNTGVEKCEIEDSKNYEGPDHQNRGLGWHNGCMCQENGRKVNFRILSALGCTCWVALAGAFGIQLRAIVESVHKNGSWTVNNNEDNVSLTNSENSRAS